MSEAMVISALILGSSVAYAGHRVGLAIMYLAFTLSRMGVHVKDGA